MFQKILFERKLVVQKSKLIGKVKISGAKNSALRLLAASLLTDEDITISNSPNALLDMKVHIEMLKRLGKDCIVDNGKLTISYGSELKDELIWEGHSIRNTLLIFGALLARKGKAKVPLPGGCKIGERKYDLHIMLLEKLGAKIWEESEYLVGEVPNDLRGTEIRFPFRSVGATENALIVGSMSKGKTAIWNPHIQPELYDLVSFLKKMGVKIKLKGRSCIEIEGSNYLKGCNHRVIPDNVEAITYAIGAAITKGEVEIEDFPYKHLDVPLIYLREGGIKIYKGNNSIIIKSTGCYALEIVAESYPGIKSDLQPLFTVFALCAPGVSKIVDVRYPERFKYVEELKRMGAEVKFDDGAVTINGVETLKGCRVNASDLRGGASLLLAGLVAEGTTVIANAWQIERGYENIDVKMQSLGGRVKFE